MISDKRILAIIPARGGSKGVKKKNIRNINGKPLIAWTIAAAKKSQYIDRLILSSDDLEIIEIAKNLGCEAPYVRPAELAADESPTIESVLHVLGLVKGYELVVLLQPTSPLRSSEDIDKCIEECINLNVNSCVSITEVTENPYWMFAKDEDNRLQKILGEVSPSRRQDLPTFYRPNGAVYVAKIDWLVCKKTFITRETIGSTMPNIRSLDIDNESDLTYFEYLVRENIIPAPHD